MTRHPAAPEARLALKVGIAGFGAIGRRVADALHAGIPGLTLEAICSRDLAKARHDMANRGLDVAVVNAYAMALCCDVVVDCAPGGAFDDIVRTALKQRRHVITVNGGALMERLDLWTLIAEGGGSLTLASGALLGFDAVRAAAEGVIHSVSLITRKPPQSLRGAPHLESLLIDLETLSEPMMLFRGSVRDSVAKFPANVNVAAALAMAGIGPDRTTIEVWADPSLNRNTHRIEVDADSSSFSMQIENVPSADNPATGYITALSVISTLRQLTSQMKIGS